jgi:hypothetical protein
VIIALQWQYLESTSIIQMKLDLSETVIFGVAFFCDQALYLAISCPHGEVFISAIVHQRYRDF